MFLGYCLPSASKVSEDSASLAGWVAHRPCAGSVATATSFARGRCRRQCVKAPTRWKGGMKIGCRKGWSHISEQHSTQGKGRQRGGKERWGNWLRLFSARAKKCHNVSRKSGCKNTKQIANVIIFSTVKCFITLRLTEVSNRRASE
jgi:hypothetical protein